MSEFKVGQSVHITNTEKMTRSEVKDFGEVAFVGEVIDVDKGWVRIECDKNTTWVRDQDAELYVDPRDAEIQHLREALKASEELVEKLKPYAILDAIRRGDFVRVEDDSTEEKG